MYGILHHSIMCVNSRDACSGMLAYLLPLIESIKQHNAALSVKKSGEHWFLCNSLTAGIELHHTDQSAYSSALL